MTKCDYCGRSVSRINTFMVQTHWAAPRRLEDYCKECCVKQGLEWKEYKEGEGAEK